MTVFGTCSYNLTADPLSLPAMHFLEDFLSRRLPGAVLAAVKRSRLITASAWRILRIWQNLTGSAPNALRQLDNIEPAPVAGSGGRVLIFSLRGWTAHLAWETTLARALHLRGSETLTVLCDRALPACEPRTVGNDYASTCDRCMAQSGGLLSRTGLPYGWLSEYLEPGEEEWALRRVEGLDLEALRAVEAEGVPVGRLVAASVNRHLLRGGREATSAYVVAYRRFVAAGIVVTRACSRLLEQFGPDRILVLNGLFYAEAILMHMADREGLPVWAYERAKRLDSLIFARDEAVVRQSYEPQWERRRTRPLTASQFQALDKYVESRSQGNVGIERLWTKQTAADASGEDGQMAVLFTNVLWDTAMFESDVTFGSQAEWIAHTIEWFRGRPARQLVIRVHPAEVRVPFKRSRDCVTDQLEATGPLPRNVRVVPPEMAVNSYELLGQAHVVLAYASTIGLEAALKGVPTVVAGRTHYRGRGFTEDPEDPAAFDRVLERAFDIRRMAPEKVELARRYAYLYFFEEIIPFPLVHEQPRSYVTFSYQSNADLSPGKEPALDAICESILKGVPLRNPYA